MTPFKIPKKLIEVALPLDQINKAAAREKSIRYGHPSTLHLWWARRPLAVARAVIFAQMVNDPGYERNLGRGINKEKAAKEREKLFKIIEQLVQWKNTNNAVVLQQAREEIWKSWRETCALNKNHPQAAMLFNPEKLPAFHDPFAGGGTLPLEAQRLGLESYASDLNPVAITINKALIEIPYKFIGQPPVGPLPQIDNHTLKRATEDAFEEWSGTSGLIEDIRRYGSWMREQAKKRIGHIYPKIMITPDMVHERPDLAPLVNQHLTVISWLWARTVKSPNPVYSHIDVPLISSYVLSSQKDRQAYVAPVVKGDNYYFTVKVGTAPESAKAGTKIPGKGAGFYCLLSNSPINGKYIKSEAIAGHINVKLMAIVAESINGRIYLTPTQEHEKVALSAMAMWKPEQELVGKARDQMPLYGMNTFGDLFTRIVNSLH